MTPIFSMIILVAFLALVVFTLSKLLGSKLWTVTMNQWIVLGYLALGLISIGVLNFTTTKEGRLSVEKSTEIFEDATALWNTLLDGETNAHYEGYLQKEWQIALTSDQLRVISHVATDISAGVLVERREDPDSNIIYAKTYVVPYQYRGFDFTERVSLEYFEYENNKLFVNQVSHQEIKFNQIYPGMLMLDQFTGNETDDGQYYSGFSTGRTILFLNVPSHVNIVDESGYVYVVR